MTERKPQRLTHTYWVTQGLLVASCILGIAGLVSQQRALNAVAHTREVQGQIERVLNRLVDAETGQRGYLLARSPEYLAPYRDAIAGIDRETAALAELTSDNPAQQAAIIPLRDRIRARLDLLAGALEAYERGAESEALAIVRSGRGMQLMQEIRADLAKMRAEEARLLAERTDHARWFGPVGWLTLITLGALSVTLVNVLRRAAWRESERVAESVRRTNAQLEARVQSRTEELREANADLQAFAHSVAHDLRAPLRNIQGYATAIIEDEAPRLSGEGALYARRMAESAGRLDDLIQDLLAYSRLARADIASENVDLDRLVAQVMHELAGEVALREAGITVQPAMPAVRAHRSTLAQVIANLVLNALKFVAPDKTASVAISATRRDDRVRITIADNGIGIAPEHQERIFRVFERLHGSESYPGTGIGLAIVRRGVERMGGHVTIESAHGAGSRFHVELPAARETP